MELINSPWAVDDDVPRGEKAHKSKSRIVISVSKCVIAFLSAAQISTTVLFLVKGFLLWSRIGYWAISAALFASALSALCFLRDWLSRRKKTRDGEEVDKPKRSHSNASAILLVAWLVAAVLGLMVAIRRQACSGNLGSDGLWGDFGRCIVPGVSAGISGTALLCSLILFACNKVSEVLYEADEPDAEHDNTNDSSERNSAVWPIAGREKMCFESIESTSTSNDDSTSRSGLFHQRRTSWLPPLRFQRQSIPEASLPRFDAPSQPLLSRSQTINTNSSSEYSRNTYSSVSYLSRHPSTMSTYSSLSHGSSCRSSPLNTMHTAAKPTVPKIPEKFKHESHSLRHGGKPVRPGSRPAMPPAEFWKYTSKQQVRRAPSSGNPPVFRPIAETSEREPSVCRYPIIMQPKRPLLRTRPITVNSHVAQLKDRSYESLRKGLHSRSTNRSSSAQLRQSVALYEQRETDRRREKRPERRQSRTLVKQRQPFDCDPRPRTKAA